MYVVISFLLLQYFYCLRCFQGYFFPPYEPCVTGTSILAPLVLNINRKTATNVLNTIESLVANWEGKFPCEEGRDRAIQRGRHSPVIV